MRFLKNKLALAILDTEDLDGFESSCSPGREKIPLVRKALKKSKSSARKKQKRNSEEEEKLATKNIIKNYGRAIANFALSDLFLPYVEEDRLKSQIDWDQFLDFAKTARDAIQNIETLRDSLIIKPEDSENEATFKKLFQKAGELFIKNYSLDWIFSGKLIYKEVYVRARDDLLKKILNPETLIAPSSPQNRIY